MTQSDQPQYTRDQVSKAVNKATEDIWEELDLDSDVEDVLNLVVNAALSYLDGTCADLHQVAEENYSDLQIIGGELVFEGGE